MEDHLVDRRHQRHADQAGGEQRGALVDLCTTAGRHEIPTRKSRSVGGRGQLRRKNAQAVLELRTLGIVHGGVTATLIDTALERFGHMLVQIVQHER